MQKHLLICLALIICIQASAKERIYPYDIADYRSPVFFQQRLSFFPSSDIRGTTSTNGLDQVSKRNYSYGRSRIAGNHAIDLHQNAWEYYGDHGLSLSYSKDWNRDSLDWGDRAMNSPDFYTNDGSSFDMSGSLSERIRRYWSGPLFSGVALNVHLFGSPCNTSKKYTNSYTQTFGRSNDSLRAIQTQSERKSTTSSLNISLQIDGGIGGIANVTDAAVALIMLDKIEVATNELMPLSNVQIDSFATFLELQRRRRVFDWRDRKKETIDSIYTYLLRHSIVDKENVHLAMELVEALDYGYTQERSAGVEWKVFPMATANYHLNDMSLRREGIDSAMPAAVYYDRVNVFVANTALLEQSDNTFTNWDNTAGVGTLLSATRPWSRFVQVNAGISVKGMLVRQGSSTVRTNRTALQSSFETRQYTTMQPLMTMQVEAGVSWYPTLRTSIKTFVYADYNRQFNFLVRTQELSSNGFPATVDNWDLNYTRTYANYGISESITYYVSPQISYSISGSLTYDTNYLKDDHYSTKQQSTALNYSLSGNLTWQVF